jgi:hypothetical protein
MDSLYFTELMERSENDTQQETGEHRTYMEQATQFVNNTLLSF